VSKLQILYAQEHFAPYMQKVHPDDKASGIVTRIWDSPHPKENRCALLVLPQLPDYTEGITLHPEGLQRSEIIVDFDAAEYRGRMWLRDEGENEDWVAIEGPENAIKVAMHLLAWAYAAQQQEAQNGPN
jgi:hypothetical protein